MGSWAFFQEKYVAYSRFLSCCCVWCRTGKKNNMVDKCVNISTVGKLKAHKMNALDVDSPSPNKRRRLDSIL